ncbi:MAG TPA: hypothetical protein VGJ00_06380 [Rhabdochlamydiaceae bacterium]|jgi:hypothetical protein
MKKIVTCLFCGIMAMMASGWAEAQSEKLYIAPENLHIEDQSLFVFAGDVWQQVSAVYSDANGLFIERMPDSETWYCRDCKAWHRRGEQCPQR